MVECGGLEMFTANLDKPSQVLSEHAKQAYQSFWTYRILFGEKIGEKDSISHERFYLRKGASANEAWKHANEALGSPASTQRSAAAIDSGKWRFCGSWRLRCSSQITRRPRRQISTAARTFLRSQTFLRSRTFLRLRV